MSREFGSEGALPSPRLPQALALQESFLIITACLSLVGVTAPLFSPCQAAQTPEVTYEADKGSMWTLLLTNLGKCPGLTGPPAPFPPMSQCPGELGEGPKGVGGGSRALGQ